MLGKLETRPELGLTDQDRHDLELIYREFFRQGLEIKYDSWRSFFFPSLNGTCQQLWDTRELHLVSLDYGGETREVGAIDINIDQDLVA